MKHDFVMVLIIVLNSNREYVRLFKFTEYAFYCIANFVCFILLNFDLSYLCQTRLINETNRNYVKYTVIGLFDCFIAYMYKLRIISFLQTINLTTIDNTILS